MNYNFKWDPLKALANYRKHGVRFEEAATVFKDPGAMTLFDPDHSEQEDRWITMGISGRGRLLVVCHTFMEENSSSVTIRIFSSRKATRKEAGQYGK